MSIVTNHDTVPEEIEHICNLIGKIINR